MGFICDFCSEPNPAWSYPADNFIGHAVGGIVAESIGAWAACEVCHELIAADNRAGLTKRSVSTLLAKQPALDVARIEVTGELRELHAKFFLHRVGDPMPILRVRVRIGGEFVA